MSMRRATDLKLLRSCVACMHSGLDPRDARALRQRAKTIDARAATVTASLLAQPETQWEDVVQGHRAHRHAWHDELAERATIDDFAAFLLENWAFPAFLPLLHRARVAQIVEGGRDAIDRNIADEQTPVPHADLMRRLVLAVKAKAGAEPQLATHPSLIDRTVVFYQGHYGDPWYLVGALYATEALARYRVTRMGSGLRRLGLAAIDLEFIRIHSECDDDHARDWREGVIAGTVAARPELRTPIAQGVAACLETSAVYFDELLARSQRARRTGGAS